MTPPSSLRTVKLANGRVRVFVSTQTGSITVALVGQPEGAKEPTQVHETLTVREARALISNLNQAIAKSQLYTKART